MPATQHYLFYWENVQKKWSVNRFDNLLKERFSRPNQIFMIVSRAMEALSNTEQYRTTGLADDVIPENPVWLFYGFYWWRSAVIGSTFAARRAGR